MSNNNNIQEMEDVKYNNNNNFFNMNFNYNFNNNSNINNNNNNNNNKEDNNSLKMSGCNRKRRLSKLPTPVIIPPPSPSSIISTSSSSSSSTSNTLINNVVNGRLSSPISPAKSDSFFDLPASPRNNPHSPTKRFVLKPINAITAALQRTTITGKNKSILRFPKSPKSLSKTFNNNNNINNTNNNNINNYDNSNSSSSNNNNNTTITTNNNSPKSYQKPPKSPKILHKGSNNSIRKKLDSPTTSSFNSNISNLSLNLTQPATDDDNNSNNNNNNNNSNNNNNDSNYNSDGNSCNKQNSFFKPVKFRQPKSSASTCKKALPIVPAELAERLRESYPSFNSNTGNENELEKAAEENKMYSLTSSSLSSLSSATTIKPSLKPILIDVRNLALYENEHICESFNVNLPTLLIKRYRRGSMSNFSLDSFITTPEGRDKYFDIINNNVNNNSNDENSNINNSNININGMKLQHDVIVFDETMNENDKVSPGWTLLSVLERVMMSNNDNLLETPDSLSPMDDSNRGRVYWLKGGFEAFKSWDKKGEFIMSGLDVSLNNNNNSSSGSNTATSPSISSCSSDNDKEGYLDSISNSSLDVENQGASLVRRDSLFSVNTERSSLRRKKSGKNPSDNNNNNNTIAVPQQIDENQYNQEKSEEYNNYNNNNNNNNNNDILKLRRPSNGLQYLFKSTSKNGEQLSICLTNQDLTPSILVTNLDNSNRNDDLDLDSPCTPPPITHPEVAFVVSTIVPDFLFLGPEITKEEEVEELESKGIRRILNMAFECEDNLGLNQKFEKYLKVSVKDLVEEDVENGLKLAVDFIDQAYNDNTPIYVHCKAGKSRSVTAVLAYLIKSRHWTLRHAYDYVMERRSGICPNIGFVAELMRVEEGVLGHKRVNGAMTHVGFRRKDNMLDMESINPLGNIPRTAFF